MRKYEVKNVQNVMFDVNSQKRVRNSFINIILDKLSMLRLLTFGCFIFGGLMGIGCFTQNVEAASVEEPIIESEDLDGTTWHLFCMFDTEKNEVDPYKVFYYGLEDNYIHFYGDEPDFENKYGFYLSFYTAGEGDNLRWGDYYCEDNEVFLGCDSHGDELSMEYTTLDYEGETYEVLKLADEVSEYGEEPENYVMYFQKWNRKDFSDLDVEKEIIQIRSWVNSPTDLDKKVVLEKGTDGWNYKREYYYHDGKLIFAFLYDKEEEHRLYYKDDTMIRYIDDLEEIHDYDETQYFYAWEKRVLKEAYEDLE